MMKIGTELCKCSWYRALSIDIHLQVKIKYFSSDQVIGEINQCFLVFSGLVLILLEPSHHFHFLEINVLFFYTLGNKSLRELYFFYRNGDNLFMMASLQFCLVPPHSHMYKYSGLPLYINNEKIFGLKIIESAGQVENILPSQSSSTIFGAVCWSASSIISLCLKYGKTVGSLISNCLPSLPYLNTQEKEKWWLREAFIPVIPVGTCSFKGAIIF